MDLHGTGPRERHKPSHRGDAPISKAYSTLDSDLARDNLENDIPAADLVDLRSDGK